MKKLFVIMTLCFSSLLAQTKEDMLISFSDSLVTLDIKGKVIAPHFTPGNHGEDNYISFEKKDNIYSSKLPNFSRGMSSFKIGKSISLYHISSGHVPENLKKKLSIKVNIPKGKALLWCGRDKILSTKEEFQNYFVAREFPFILAPQDKYLKRISKFSDKDSLTVFYVWEDSTTKASLPSVFNAVDSAACIIGKLFPKYLKKMVNYGGRNYSLVVIINKKVVTGLEHFNAPYLVVTPNSVSVGSFLHTLLHSFIGKAVIPIEYMKSDGRFYPSDVLGFYEGLTTFMSMKYEKNFFLHLSGTLFRSKISPKCSDLTQISVCGAEIEKWYSNGYLFAVYLQSEGLDIEDSLRWLYEEKLIKYSIFPVQINWSDILNWISEYDMRVGEKARIAYKGDYVNYAFGVLKANGWSMVPVWEVPRWYDEYIGPYPIKKGGISLPTDNYPRLDAYPKFLLRNNEKLSIELKEDNLALKFIKTHSDSIFQIEFSDGNVLSVENKLKFSDGSPYFMHGTIGINENNRKFWQKLNVYIK